MRAFLIAAFGTLTLTTSVQAEEDIAKLIMHLKDKDVEVRCGAAYSLGEMKTDDSDALLALVAALDDASPRVRHWSADALGKIGAAAVPALQTALKGKSAPSRFAAAYALARMGPDAK